MSAHDSPGSGRPPVRRKSVHGMRPSTDQPRSTSSRLLSVPRSFTFASMWKSPARFCFSKSPKSRLGKNASNFVPAAFTWNS